MSEQFRVQDKKNVTIIGRKATAFTLFERAGDYFVHRGRFAAEGWGASDQKCIGAALAEMEDAEIDHG